MNTSSILALDPGTTQTGWVFYSGGKVVWSGIDHNEKVLNMVAKSPAEQLAVEMIASYGMAVGREVFETCVWVGRFLQAWREPGKGRLVYRKDVKLELCGTNKAKDANIRAALIDRVGEVGTKSNPGPCYGVKSHVWAALGVAVTAEVQLRGLQ